MYEYDSRADREVAGLIASAFALGRVKSIIDAGSRVLQALGNPAKRLRNDSSGTLRRRFAGFRYRFFSDHDLVSLLIGIGEVLRKHGSLESSFMSHLGEADLTSIPALKGFIADLNGGAGGPLKMLADPSKGSACKRLHLYLRWMIRNDAVDPGVWRSVSPAILVAPMDVHMNRISAEMGFVRRKQADIKAALEATEYFRAIRPDDPVRYDFCLTRMGIHPELAGQEMKRIIDSLCIRDYF